MTEDDLRKLLTHEILAWSRKPFLVLEAEMAKEPIVFDRGSGNGNGWHQFELNLLENAGEYLHIGIAVDDGSDSWTRFPLSSSFIVRRDGRVEI